MCAADEILFSVTDSPSSAEADIVDGRLGEFNRQAAPIHTVKRLACFAKLPSCEVVGGAVGSTWGLCCELQHLWVSEDYRHRGIATQLVRMFEDEAYARGCRTYYLETFSFQAPELYRAMRYEAKLRITGFPEGITKYVMVREVD